MMKASRILITVMLLLGGAMSSFAAQRDSTSRKLGDNHLFMPKGAVSVGMQFSYLDIGSGNTTVMLLLKGLDATGTYFGIGPYFGYTFKDNKTIGARLKYSNTTGVIGNARLELPGLDIDLGVDDLNANSSSLMAELFYRSYMGLDNKGRFGLFFDIALQYTNSTSSFGSGPEAGSALTKSNKLRLAARPGLEVFVMNNVSSVFSLGIGVISYTNSKNVRNGEVTGVRNTSNARFMPDITDISMGLAIHF